MDGILENVTNGILNNVFFSGKVQTFMYLLKNMSNLDNPRIYHIKETRLVRISPNIVLYLYRITKEDRMNVWKVT